MGLMELFGGAVAAGADPAEFRQVWKYQEFVQRAEAALQSGDLAGATALLAVCPVDWTKATAQALQAVLAGHAMTALALAWPEDGGEVPASVTEGDVEAAMRAAGYMWAVHKWVHE